MFDSESFYIPSLFILKELSNFCRNFLAFSVQKDIPDSNSVLPLLCGWSLGDRIIDGRINWSCGKNIGEAGLKSNNSGKTEFTKNAQELNIVVVKSQSVR